MHVKTFDWKALVPTVSEQKPDLSIPCAKSFPMRRWSKDGKINVKMDICRETQISGRS